MKQLTKTRSVIYHLYPGIFITLGFIGLGPLSIKYGFPPQFGMLLSVLLIAFPVLILHLWRAKKAEHLSIITDLNGLKKQLPTSKLLLYALGLVIIAFLIWGITQQANKIIADRYLNWLPKWYTVYDFTGYARNKVILTLILNLVFNGLMAPVLEEFYFRGYLLPRMQTWGKLAFFVNAVLFSLYHFWQPTVYLTLILALLPMTYVTFNTKDNRLSILTHCLMNVLGAILSFGMLVR